MTLGLVIWIWLAINVAFVWLMWRHYRARQRLRAATRLRLVNYRKPNGHRADVDDVIHINGRWRRVVESNGRDVTVEDMDE